MLKKCLAFALVLSVAAVSFPSLRVNALSVPKYMNFEDVPSTPFGFDAATNPQPGTFISVETKPRNGDDANKALRVRIVRSAEYDNLLNEIGGASCRERV